MKKLQKIIDLLLKVIELLPILIEFLKAIDRDTEVIKSNVDSLNLKLEQFKDIPQVPYVEDIKQFAEAKNKK